MFPPLSHSTGDAGVVADVVVAVAAAETGEETGEESVGSSDYHGVGGGVDALKEKVMSGDWSLWMVWERRKGGECQLTKSETSWRRWTIVG